VPLITETIEIPAGNAAVSFGFSDADAFAAWWKHRNAKHPERME